MRTTSHGLIMPVAIAAESRVALPTRSCPQRRVMRAAWSLYRDGEITFSSALKVAWRHEKARSGLSAAISLKDEIVSNSYINGIVRSLRGYHSNEDLHSSLRSSRSFMIDLIHRLIEALDAIEGDPDDECCSPDEDADDELDCRNLPHVAIGVL